MAVTGRAVPIRGEVHLVELDPTRGSEIRKARPCVVISPDELNRHLNTVIVAPLTTGGSPYPWRVSSKFQGQPRTIATDQVRTVDKERLVKPLGTIDSQTLEALLNVLQEMFAA